MKKLPIFVGSTAALAVALLYFRAEIVPAPQLESLSTVESATVPPAVPRQAGVVPQAERKIDSTPQKVLPQTLLEDIQLSDDFPLPEPLVDEGHAEVSEMELWQLPEEPIYTQVDNLPAVAFAIDPQRLARLRVGQVVHLQLPDGTGEVEAEIQETYNDPAGVQVWKGSVNNDVNPASVILTRGEIQTHIVIATTQGNFSAVVDNRTGDGTLINESTIHSRQLPYDDGIVYRPGDTEATHQH